MCRRQEKGAEPQGSSGRRPLEVTPRGWPQLAVRAGCLEEQSLVDGKGSGFPDSPGFPPSPQVLVGSERISVS